MMKRILGAFLGLTALALLALPPAPAHAAAAQMCAPSAQSGTRQIGGATSSVPSGATYTLNARGCALIAQADIAYFQSQGFVMGPELFSIVASTGVLTSTTSVQIGTLPAGAYIQHIFVNNTTANAVTGGIDIGKTSGAADIVSAKTCAASCLSFIGDSALLLRVFSLTAPQPIWALGHTDGNSANLTFTIVYGYF